MLSYDRPLDEDMNGLYNWDLIDENTALKGALEKWICHKCECTFENTDTQTIFWFDVSNGPDNDPWMNYYAWEFGSGDASYGRKGRVPYWMGFDIGGSKDDDPACALCGETETKHRYRVIIKD